MTSGPIVSRILINSFSLHKPLSLCTVHTRVILPTRLHLESMSSTIDLWRGPGARSCSPTTVPADGSSPTTRSGSQPLYRASSPPLRIQRRHYAAFGVSLPPAPDSGSFLVWNDP